MGYEDYVPMANKFLLPDGSITSFDNVEVLPPDAARALLYLERVPAVAKWLMPNGSMVSAIPVEVTSQSPIEDLDHVHFNTVDAPTPTVKGSMYWDRQDETLSVIVSDTGVTLQIGQETYIRAVNKTGATIANGKVVFISGATGNRAKVELASASNYNDAARVIGITTSEILNNQEGYITTSGLVRDINTQGIVEGTCLYLSTVAGAYTSVKPADGTIRIQVGMIIKEHVTDGWICVKVHDDKYMYGDIPNGNYTLFENNGILVSKGTAVTWRDEYAAGIYFTPSGASAPDEVSVIIGGVTTRKYAFDGGTTIESLNNTFEIPHELAVDQVNANTVQIEQHIHVAPSTNLGGVCRFTIDWCLIKAQGAPIAGTQVVLLKTILPNTQYHNIIFGDSLPLPVGGYGIGDLIEFTLSRTPSHADDTYAGDILLYKTALHIPMDTLGSRQRYIK